NALQGLGQVLARTGKRDAAECYLTEAVALWDRIAAGTKGQPGPVADKARVRVTLADHLAGRGRPDLALPPYAHAAALTDGVVKEDPNVAARWQHRMFGLQSLVFDRDWRAAAEGADKLTTADLDPGAGCELARVWCRVARAAANDPGLSPDGRAAEAERAFVKAVALLERGKAAGVFRRPGLAPRCGADHDFVPLRDR